MAGTRIAVVAVTLLSVASSTAGSERTGEPRPPSEEATKYPNIVVPHEGESRDPTQQDLTGIVEKDSDDAIDLMEVGEVVAIPESAQKEMFRKDRQLDDQTIVGVSSDGWLQKEKTGVRHAAHLSQNKRFLFQGVEQSIEIDGQATTRPMLIVRMWTDRSRPSVQERYPLAVKTVKSGESRIEPGMELRGGVKAVAESIAPGSYDVFMELILPGEDEKKVLVRGTFDEEAIPALRKDAPGVRGEAGRGAAPTKTKE